MNKGMAHREARAGLRELTRNIEIHRNCNSRKGKFLEPLGLTKQGKN